MMARWRWRYDDSFDRMNIIQPESSLFFVRCWMVDLQSATCTQGLRGFTSRSCFIIIKTHLSKRYYRETTSARSVYNTSSLARLAFFLRAIKSRWIEYFIKMVGFEGRIFFNVRYVRFKQNDRNYFIGMRWTRVKESSTNKKRNTSSYTWWK